MGSKLDMALDDIIKTTKPTRGAGRARGGGRPRGGSSGAGGARGRGGARGGARGGGGGFRGSMSNGAGRSGVSSGRWNHDMFQGSAGSSRMMANSVAGPIKLCISNLDYGVTDSDIRELFQEFGDLRSAAVHYDRSGCSLGSAQVVFGRQTSAMNALKQYNGVHLDGRPMKIFIEGTPPIGSLMGSGPTGRPMVKRLNAGARPAPLMSGAGGRGGRGARGGGRGGRGGRSSEKTKPKTAEELDAELDNYLCEAKKTK